MQKDKRGFVGKNFLKIFKKFICSLLIISFVTMQTACASDITVGSGGFGTTIKTDGNEITISGGKINNGTGFHHFGNFWLTQGDILNYMMDAKADRYVNLVDNQVRIDGIFNSFKQGLPGRGNVIFVSPMGMIVGASGIMNVGSLQTITPLKSTYDSLVALGKNISYNNITSLKNNSETSSTTIDGKIFSANDINIGEAGNLTLGKGAMLVSGFNRDGFALTRSGNLTGIVNTDGVVNANFMTDTGSVKIVANKITTEDTSSLIHATGNINIDTTAKDAITIGSRIKAGGNVGIGQSSLAGDVTLSNKIDAGGKLSINSAYTLTQEKGAQINADSVAVDTGIINIKDNITANNGIELTASNEFNQSADTEITNNISGSLNITSNLGDVSTGKITNKGGNIKIAAGNLVINDTIDASGSMDLTARKSVTQKDDTFTALKAGGDLNVITYADLGTASQSLNVDIGGNIDITNNEKASSVYLSSKDSDLNITKITNATDVSLESSKGVTVHQNINANSSVNINAQEGFTQNSDSVITNTGSGGINITNSGSGDVNINSLNSTNGNVTIANNNSTEPPTPGNVNINGTINADNGSVSIDSQGNITQSSENKSISASQDISLVAKGDIGSEDKHIIVSAGNSLSAKADGAVSLTGEDTSIKLSDISAGTDLNITTTGKGDITFDTDLSDIQGDFRVETERDLNIDTDIHATGDVSIVSSGGDVILNALITSVEESINIGANGSIIQSDSYSGTTLNAAKDITLIAKTGDVGGSLQNAVQMELGGAVLVEGTNVYLTSPGSLNIAGINKDGRENIGVVNIATTTTDNGNIHFSGLVNGSDVTVSAAQGITQTEGIKSINATGALSLVSQNGSIGQQGNAISFSAGSVSADSSESVVLTGIDTDITTTTINAKKDIDLSTQIVDDALGKGNITVADSLETQNGYIRLDSARQLNIDQNLTAGKTITLNANGGIVQKQGTTFTSGTNTTDPEGGNITITNKGSGNITLDNVVANNGNIVVENTALLGNVLLNSTLNAVDGNISVTTLGNIIQGETNTNTALTAAGNITLNALNAGSEDSHLLLNAGGTLNGIVNNMYVTDTEDSLTIGSITANNDVFLTAEGNIQQADYSKTAITSGGSVNLTSTDGNIGSDSPDNALVVSGTGKVNADAYNIYLTSNDKLVTGSLNAQNDISVSSKSQENALEISGDMTANGLISINSENGIQQTEGIIHTTGEDSSIEINSTQGTIALKDVTSDNGYISIQNGGGGLSLESVLSAQNSYITIDVNGNIEQIGEQTSLIAGDDIFVFSNGYDIGSEAQYLTFSSGNGITANSGNGSLFLKGVDTNISTSKIFSNGNIGLIATGVGNVLIDDDLTTTGGYIDIVVNTALDLNHKLQAAGDITLQVNGAVTQNGYTDNALVSGANVYINTNSNTIGTDTNSVKVSASGQVNAEGSDIYLGSKGADFNAGNITSSGENIKITTEDSGQVNLKGLVTGKNLTVNSADGIYQSGTDKTIDVSNALVLNTTNNDIGRQDNAVIFKAGSVSASATNGSIVLKGIDTDIHTSTIDAGKNIDLSTELTDESLQSGNIFVENNLVTSDGYINLDSAKALHIDKNIEAGHSITLNANGGIEQVGSSQIKAGTSSDAQDGSVTITNNGSGNISLGSVSSQKSDVNIINNALNADVILNSLVDASSGNVVIDAKGAIIQSDSITGHAINAGGNINLTAQNDIGSASQKITVNADGTVSAAGTGIYLDSPEKTLNLAGITSGGIVDISTTTSGDINIKDNTEVTGTDITLSAANGIYQDGANKSITAQGKLSLTAQNGDLGKEGNAIVFKADSVKASAQNGSVILNGVETDINTDEIIAGNNIDLSTTTSGNINIINAITADGYIRLNSAEALNVTQNITSTGSSVTLGAVNDVTLNAQVKAQTDVTVDTQGNIIQNSGLVSAGNDITLNAAGNVGAVGQEIAINAGNVLNSNAADIFIKNTQGGLKIGEIVSQNTVNLTASGDITQDNPSKIGITATGDINLVSSGGDIGKSSTDSVAVNTEGVVNAEASNIYMSSDKNFNTGSITASQTGNVDIRTTADGSDIVIKNLMKGGNIVLNAKGSVKQDSTLSKSIEADNLDITAQTGDIGETGNAIDFSSTGSLSANAQQGSVILNGIDTDIYVGSASGGGSIVAGKSIDLSTENSGGIFVQSALTANDGYIRLNSVESLNLSEDITASEKVELISQTGDILLDALINAGTDIVVDSDGKITAGNENVLLTAGNDITLNANSTVGEELQKIKVNADNNVTVTGSSVYLQSPGKIINLAGINSGGVVDISTTTSGDINIRDNSEITGSDITLNAADGIYQEGDEKTITASGKLDLTANNTDIGRENNALIFAADSVKASAEKGSIVLNGIDVDIKTDTINAGKNIDLSTTNSGNIIIQSELSTQNGGYIRLNSAQSLVVDKNITSSDYLFLGAKEGLELSAIIQAVNDITMETQGGINQISGSVTSTAGKVLASNTVSGGIILNNVAAQTGMNITNTGDSAALVAVGNLVSAGGNLNIVNATGGNVDLTGNIESSNGNVSINSDEGNIVKQDTSATVIAGQDIFLGGKSVGSADKFINTNAGGAVSGRGQKLYLENTTGEFKIGNIETVKDTPQDITEVNLVSKQGDITFNGLVQGDNVNVNSSNGIKQDTALTTPSIEADRVTLTANNGDVGAADNAIDMKVTGALNVDKAGNVYIHGADTGNENALNIGNINADNIVKLTSDSGIRLNGLIQGQTADLTANGDITQSDSIEKSFDVDSLNLVSTAGNIGLTGHAIDFVAGSLHANAAGSVVLNGIGLDIETGDIIAGKDIDLSTTGSGNITISKDMSANGYIRLNSAEGLIVNKNLNATGYIELIAQGGEMILSSLIEATDVTLNAAGGITQESGKIVSTGTNGVNVTNTTAGSIELVDVTASNGNINITNDETAAGSIILGNLTAGKDISVSNLSEGEIRLNSNISGADINLIATGGISQIAGNITATGENGLNASNSVSGGIKLNNITAQNGGVNIANDNSASGSIIVGKIDALKDVSLSNLSGNEIILNSDVTGADVSIVSTGGIIQQSGNIISSGDSGFNAQNSQSGSIELNDITSANGVNIENTASDPSDIELNKISNTNGLVYITNATGGNVLLNALVESSNGSIIIDTANGNIEQNIAGIALKAGGDISLKAGNHIGTADSYIKLNSGGSVFLDANNLYIDSPDMDLNIAQTDNTTGSVNIKTSGADADLNLNSNVSAADITLSSVSDLNSAGILNSRGNVSLQGNNVSVNSINTGSSYSITGNGLVNVSGTLTNNADSSITANNSGTDSGIIIADTAVLNNNNGSLNITNNGANGLAMNGTIINNGNMTLENNAGSMILAGEIDAKVGSVNTFINGADEDMNISMDLESFGTTITFENRGQGSLIVDENANLAVNGIQQGDTFYAGELNLNNMSNSDQSGISIKGTIAGDNGTVNITNNGQNGITFENGSNVNTGSDINVINNKGSLTVAKDASITSRADISIENKQAAQSVNFDGTVHGKNVTVQSNGSNINIAHNKEQANISADENIEITAQNADILNNSLSEAPVPNAGGISAGNNIELSADNIGSLDDTLGNIIKDGFVLDADKSIHVNAGGNITADAQETLNLLAVNGNLNLDSVSAKDAILSALYGNITGNSITSDNLYAFAASDSGKISLDNMNIATDVYAEAGSHITMNSNSALNIQSALSRNDSIDITSEGNTEIREIAALKDINITVNDEKLTIINLGRVERAQDVIPENVNLTVLDAKRQPSGSYTPGMSPEELENLKPNSKLDIYNAYVQNKATLKADTITAQVYDISDDSVAGQKRVDKYGNEATGFHNANKNGDLLEFDIQGANYAQGDAGSDPHNPYYSPDANDKHALNVHLTLGDSVGDALYGANFKKLYSDYAFIDSINTSNPDAFSKIVIESGIIGEKAIIRNNNLRLDINNTDVERDYAINKHYNDAPDKEYTNHTSFNSEMFDTIIVDKTDKPDIPDVPVIPPDPSDDRNPYNPNRQVKDPVLTDKVIPISRYVQEAENKDSTAVDADKSTGIKQIRWVVRDKENRILGASESELIKEPVVDSVIKISKKGIVVTADTVSDDGLKLNQNVQIDLKYKEIAFNVDGQVKNINGRIVEIAFVNVDKLTSTVMLFLSMFSENL